MKKTTRVHALVLIALVLFSMASGVGASAEHRTTDSAGPVRTEGSSATALADGRAKSDADRDTYPQSMVTEPSRQTVLAELAVLQKGGDDTEETEPTTDAPAEEAAEDAADADGWIYEITDGHVRILGYTGPEMDLVIPDKLEGLPVTTISAQETRGTGDISFLGFLKPGFPDNIVSVTVPSTVEMIETMAFYGCYGLTRVVLCDGVKEIDGTAFSTCWNLSEITIPESVSAIGSGAFYGCESLTSIAVPASADISGNPFEECTGLTEIELTEGTGEALLSVEDGVLFDADQTTLLCYPAGKTDETYSIPDTVEDIAWEAFDGCSYLRSVTLPADMSAISAHAFDGCSGLESIGFPQTLQSIGLYAFAECENLRTVEIPDGVTGIYAGAFRYCAGLTAVRLPADVEFIACYAFDDCENLTDIYYAGSEEEWEQIEIDPDNEFLDSAAIHFGVSEIPAPEARQETLAGEDVAERVEASESAAAAALADEDPGGAEPAERLEASEPTAADAPVGETSVRAEAAGKGGNAAFVREVARAVTIRTDGPEMFYAGEDAIKYDLETEPTLQPWFAMLRFKAEEDPDDPALVHYSCRIPGAVGACFNMAYDVCFKKNGSYSKWVSIEGEVRVVTDEDGNRQIDISRGDNAFAVYAALRYINPLFFMVNGVDISGGLSDEDFSVGLNILLDRSCDAYAAALGVSADDYAQNVIIPELETYQTHMSRIIRGSTSEGYGFLNWYRSLSTGAKILIFGDCGFLILWVLWTLIAKIASAVKGSGKKKRALGRNIVSTDWAAPELLDGIAVSAASGSSTFDSFCTAYRERHVSFWNMKDVRAAAKMAVVLAQKPEDSEDALRLLCKTIHLGLRLDAVPDEENSNAEAYRHELLTAAGWSAAALGRILAQKMSPGQISQNLESLSSAIDRSNETLDKLREQHEIINKASETLRILTLGKTHFADRLEAEHASRLSKEIEAAKMQIERCELEYNQGLGGFMLDNGDLPLAYLMFLLRDSQNRYPRFIKQGVIMGLVDWLVENRSDAEAAKLLQTVVSVRSDMIRSVSELTFFEVRAPMGCSRRDYAVLLADVLHCANPSLTYGDTDELLSVAEKEVPGCMDMLYACPLRLIDHANRQTMGFYKFKPYVHAMWVQYQSPLHTGKVISRYHEVDDRTKPLSSGLNLTLFRDSYAVIPTIFHEYQHFLGDRNEASVFLKTQLFSIRFYRKYRKADAKADGVFAQMTVMLGLPPAAEKREELNRTIERYYGKRVSKAEASVMATMEIDGLNRYIDMTNAGEKWDPEIRMPRFSDEEDRKNRDLIRRIVIRFATVPKSITEEEFKAILRGKAKTLQELAGMPFSLALEEFCEQLGADDGVDMCLDRILRLALADKIGIETENRVAVAEVKNLLQENYLNAEECVTCLKEHLSDAEAHDPKSLPGHLKRAADYARAQEDIVVRPHHLLYVLLQHPTRTMKKAGIVRTER